MFCCHHVLSRVCMCVFASENVHFRWLINHIACGCFCRIKFEWSSKFSTAVFQTELNGGIISLWIAIRHNSINFSSCCTKSLSVNQINWFVGKLAFPAIYWLWLNWFEIVVGIKKCKWLLQQVVIKLTKKEMRIKIFTKSGISIINVNVEKYCFRYNKINF